MSRDLFSPKPDGESWPVLWGSSGSLIGHARSQTAALRLVERRMRPERWERATARFDWVTEDDGIVRVGKAWYGGCQFKLG